MRFFRRAYWDRERSRELQAYLDIETDENIARRAAKLDPMVALRDDQPSRDQPSRDGYGAVADNRTNHPE